MKRLPAESWLYYKLNTKSGTTVCPCDRLWSQGIFLPLKNPQNMRQVSITLDFINVLKTPAARLPVSQPKITKQKMTATSLHFVIRLFITASSGPP